MSHLTSTSRECHLYALQHHSVAYPILCSTETLTYADDKTQSLEVNARTYRFNEEGVKRCLKCDLGEDEMVMHVLVECDKYDRERKKFLDVLRRECD